jgi:hypothetical protein
MFEEDIMNRKPNIIYILADDMGYGDVSYLNKESKINTKNFDKLAKEGMVFTDAHASSAVCTCLIISLVCWNSTGLTLGALFLFFPFRTCEKGIKQFWHIFALSSQCVNKLDKNKKTKK